MEFLTQLWLPILLSAVAVWFASFLAWTVIGHHKGDFTGLPNEESVVGVVRSGNVKPGVYMFPYAGCDKKGKPTPEMKKRWEVGPNGMLTIFGPISMGRNMILSLLVYLVVSVLIAYVAHEVLPRGTEFAKVMQVAGTMGVLAYAFAHIPQGIWFGQKGRAIAMCIIDGVVFGLITGAIFAAMWPK